MRKAASIWAIFLLSPSAFPLEAFNRITVFNAVRDAAEARKSCGVDPVKITQAIDAFKAILDLYPDAGYRAYAWSEIGELYLLLKDRMHAVEAFKKVVTEYPRSDYSDEAIKRLLQHGRQIKDWHGVIWAIERFISSRPAHPECDNLLLELAQIYQRQDDLARAAGTLQRLVLAYPASELAPQALHQLAALYERAQNYPAAVEAYDKIVNFYPFSDLADDAALASARCLRRAGNLQGALARLHAFVQFFPGSDKLTQARDEMVSLLREGYQIPAEPVRFWIHSVIFGLPKQSLQGEGDSAKELFEQAHRLRTERALSQAILLYTRIVQGFPGSDLRDNAQFSIGECHEELSLLAKQAEMAVTPERQAEVLDLFRGALGGKKEAKPSHFLEEAIRAYRVVVSNFPGSDLCDDALARIVNCYREMHKSKERVKAALELAVLFPWSEHVEGMTRVVGKKLKSKREFFESASALGEAFGPLAELGPGSDLYDEAVFFAACGRLGVGDFGGARKLLRKLLKTWDDSPLLAYSQFLLARSFEVEGDFEKAAQEYQTLLERFPKSGLVDDAQMGIRGDLPNLGLLMNHPSFGEAIKRTREYGADIVQRGKVVLICPFYDSPFLRAYSFPEVLAEGWEEICKVVKVESEGPVVVAFDPRVSSPQIGDPILLPMEVASEPPKYEEAFASMAERVASHESLSLLKGAIPSFPKAFGQFAGVLLRFNLVHETRDVIGGAEAAVVPFDSVKEVRDKAYQALARFMAVGEMALLTPEAACGLLFGLVEATGGYAENVVTWGPLPKVFALARTIPREAYEGRPEKALAAFAYCVEEAVGKDGAALLSRFGLRVDRKLMGKIREEMAARS